MTKINSKLPRIYRSPWRTTKDLAHQVQAVVSRFIGTPSSAMKTDFFKDGRRVIFIHNPKTGGTSLGRLLGVKRRTHAFPKDRLSEKSWLNSYVIVVVRNPLDRFFSGYYNHVYNKQDNGLVKRYGQNVKHLGLVGYLETLKENHKYGGPQENWTHYPSRVKPCADLVLKFEEIHKWREILSSEGIDVLGRAMPHATKSQNSQKDHLKTLDFSEKEIEDAVREVKAYFARDFELYGYEIGG